MAERAQRKPRICLIYTGGTIGMVRVVHDNGWILSPARDAQQFLQLLKAEEDISSIADVDFVPLMNKDSTNIIPDDWTIMADAVHARMGQYDGFVIAHGTDTMHFSASALAFAFGENLNMPVVFTGAQATPDVRHGDAKVNLLRAVKVASQDLAEVVIAFGEYVFRGCRAQKKDEKRFDAFESPAEFPLGYITEEIVVSPFARRQTKRNRPINYQPKFADGVVQLSLIPGLRPGILLGILDNKDCQGVVLQSFGAGNVPNDGPYSFVDFIKAAVNRGMPVIIASQFPANSTLASHYEPGVVAVEAGAIPTGNMTNAAATVKFRWVLHQLNSNKGLSKSDKLRAVDQMMNTNYVGELSTPNPVAKKSGR